MNSRYVNSLCAPARKSFYRTGISINSNKQAFGGKIIWRDLFVVHFIAVS